MNLLVIAAIFVVASILIVLGLSKKKKAAQPEVKPIVEPVHVKPEPIVEVQPEPVVEVKPEPVIEVAQEPVVETIEEVQPEPVVEAPVKKKPAVKKVVKNVK